MPMSIPLGGDERGDDTAGCMPTETAEGLTARTSSGLCAKKQMRRAQPTSSLQSRVRYCAGWSQHSNTPCAYSQLSPLRQEPPLRNSGQGTQL
uniref:Uncharacterized protein n=1 Tax=Arundo donax TaxID=35708 RepID=A0A0A9E4Z9_ARUDO